MQAKKDKNKEPEISSPTFAIGTRDMSGTPVPQLHQIDAGAMKFDKRSYQKDADYQALQGLIRSYNYSNSAKDEIALMDAAMAYIQKNSTGDKAVHKGRTAKAEDILYQLSMKNVPRNRPTATSKRCARPPRGAAITCRTATTPSTPCRASIRKARAFRLPCA